MKLNLGCGGRKLDGYVNIDSEAFEKPDVVCDLGAARWPFEDSSVDGAMASHVLEHLPGETFFHFLRELYRVCKPGAIVDVILPWPTHDIFRNDPTHVRPVTPTTLILFSPRYIDELAKKDMILTDFGRRHGVNFELDQNVQYRFDADVDLDDPELDWKAKHLNNIIFEWIGKLKVIK